MAPLPPVIQSPDSSLTAGCSLPIDLGKNALTQAQIEKLWSMDRANLLRCAKRHKALADFIRERDALIQGVTNK